MRATQSMDEYLKIVVQRWGSISTLLAITLGYVMIGGALAATIAHNPTETGVWAVAYLVLVGGVIQAALGVGQVLLATSAPESHIVQLELVGFNLGNLAVIAGVVFDRSWAVDLGGILLVATLAIYLRTVWGASRDRLAIGYQLLIAFVLICIPTGLILARILNSHTSH